MVRALGGSGFESLKPLNQTGELLLYRPLNIIIEEGVVHRGSRWVLRIMFRPLPR